MADSLNMTDDLDDLFEISHVTVAFAATSNVPNHCVLNKALIPSTQRKPVLSPQRVLDSDRWQSQVFGEEEDVDTMFQVMEETPSPGVSSAYGPGGGTTDDFEFRLEDHEPATKPSLKRMTLLAGNDIRIVRPSSPVQPITVADVQLEIARWMREKRSFPMNHPQWCEVSSGVVPLPVGGQTLQAGVWMWRGMEQIHGQGHTWKIYL